MEIIQEFESSSGPKKAYIVSTSLGPRVVVEAGSDGEDTQYAHRDEDGNITFPDPDEVPKYVQNLARKAFDALDDLREERHEEISFTDWLIEQKSRGRKDPIGSLALEAESDENWPTGGNRYQDFADYLQVGPMRQKTTIALSRAWSEYIREMGSDDE